LQETDEEEIVQAWIAENFSRKNYTSTEQIAILEKIDHIFFKKNEILPYLSEIAQKLNLPEEKLKHLQNFPELIEKIKELLEQKENVQVEVVKEIIEKKVVDEKLIQEKKELEYQISSILKEKENLNNQLNETKKQLEILKEKIEQKELELKNFKPDEELKKEVEELKNQIKILSHNKELLEKNLKDKDAIIAEKEREKLKLYEELSEKIEMVNNQMFEYTVTIIKSLLTDVEETLTKFENCFSAIKDKENMLVIHDHFQKIKDIIINKLNKVEESIIEKFPD